MFVGSWGNEIPWGDSFRELVDESPTSTSLSMKEILNLANEIVIKVEDSLLFKLEDHYKEACRVADSCGCPSCERGARIAEEELQEEYSRQLFEGEGDHEENRFANLAMSKVEQRITESRLDDIIVWSAELFGWDGSGYAIDYLEETEPDWDREMDWSNTDFVDTLWRTMKDQREDCDT